MRGQRGRWGLGWPTILDAATQEMRDDAVYAPQGEQARRQVRSILEMYDEGELNLEELFEIWEDIEPAPIVYGSPEYFEHVAEQRAIFEGFTTVFA